MAQTLLFPPGNGSEYHMKDEFLHSGVRLEQSESLFRLGTDAVLLADFARPEKGTAVCDLCAGTGAVGLLLLARDPSLFVTAVEIQAEACRLLQQSAEKSRLSECVTVLQADLRQTEALPAGQFRHVVCNPPYYPVGSGFLAENEAVAIAKTELLCTLPEVAAAARRLLQTGGSLWIVHRPERLADLVSALRGAGLEPKELRPVLPRPGDVPSLLLLRAVRGGKAGLKWQPPLYLANTDGTPTQEYLRIYHMEET